jgi:hypothetical protein
VNDRGDYLISFDPSRYAVPHGIMQIAGKVPQIWKNKLQSGDKTLTYMFL